jgi:protoheme IX farnesyltransferase
MHDQVVLSSAVLWLSRRSTLAALVTLFKLRVVALLLLAAVGGAFLGAGGLPPMGALLGLLVTGGMAAAGASALNQYLERERDAHMQRTALRPLVTGEITRPDWVPPVGVALIIAPVLIALPFNPALALFVALGAVIYLGVYTLWLKPRTVLNIVIGGAAGSCAVLSGGAAVGAWAATGVWALALLVFAWTPVHFWSLALAYRHDYAVANVPMLPVVTTPHRAAAWVMLHAAVAGLVTLALTIHPALGLPYLLISAPAALVLLVHSGRLLARPHRVAALALFKWSNVYLGLVLLAICLASLSQPWR